MDLFDLSATLGLDTTSFVSELNVAEKLLEGVTAVGKWQITLGVKFATQAAKDIFETGIAFDKAMSGVYAVSGAYDEATQSMLDSSVIAEAATSAFTTAEVATAAYYEGLAGYTTDEITAGLHGIVVAAEAAGEDIKPIADIITDTVRAFGDTAAEQTHYADVFAAAATSSNTTITQMGQAMKYVAPIAHSLGYNVEDVVISIATMADNATKASMAGTTLRNVFTRVATNAGATTKDLGALDVVTQKLGVSFYDSKGKAVPWLEFLTKAREAWKGLSDTEKNKVATAFAEFNGSVSDSSEVLSQFADDAKNVSDITTKMASTEDTETLNKYNEELQTYYDTYKKLFEMLGIDTAQIESGQLSLANAFDQARIKLGDLTDQEKIYYSKQIGSMRGMTGWLELMNATDDAFQSTTDSIYDCVGAADKMKETRLGSNLAGDITQIQSKIDALETLLFKDAEPAMREVAQAVMTELDAMIEATQKDGIEGFINGLANSIKNLGDKLSPVMESLGNAAAPLLKTMLETTIPQLDDSIIQLGTKLGEGLFTGLSDSMQGSLSGSLFGLLGSWLGKDMSNGTGNLTASNLGTFREATVESLTVNGVEITAAQVQAALDKAHEEGTTTVYIEGLEPMEDNWAEQLLSDLGGDVKTTIADAGVDGGKDMVTNIDGELTDSADNTAKIISGAIGVAGIDAGNTFGNNFQSSIGNRSYSINVQANVVGLPVQRNAIAMNTGRIFRKPTLFGYGEGAFQVAGDAGPEAVVGVNSLNSMIQNAVQQAYAGQEIVVPQDNGRDITIIIEMDKQVFGKAIYKANREETQRVGARLAIGGAY